MFNSVVFENLAFNEITWKNFVQPDMQKMTRQYSAIAIHAVYLRLQARTQNT
jgi:hypothetical protein